MFLLYPAHKGEFSWQNQKIFFKYKNSIAVNGDVSVWAGDGVEVLVSGEKLVLVR